VDAIETVLIKGEVGQTYNIGANNPCTNISIVEYICKILDKLKPRVDGSSYNTLINFVDDRPGHDNRYAIDSSKIEREKWLKMTKLYLKNSGKLSLVFQLIDSRIKPQNSDIDFTLFLGINKIPLSIIFTKIDKIKETIVEKNIELYKKELLKNWKKLPEIFITSSKKQIGRKKILTYISEINNSLLK